MNFPASLRRLGRAALVAACFTSTGSWGSAFGVTPLRVELGGAGRTAVVTVTNDSDKPLKLSVTAVRWTMDEQGKEHYAPTSELAFFPKALTVPPGEKRVVRVGTELMAPATEKTYRLFLRELQSQDAAVDPQAQVAMLVNFGVPIFIKSPAAKPQLAVTGTSAAAGKLTVRLENKGAASARMETIGLDGGQPVDFGSAYVLSGATRILSVPVRQDDCVRGLRQALAIYLGASQLLKSEVDLTPACR